MCGRICSARNGSCNDLFVCSYNVGCTKRVGLFPNRKTTLENQRKQRILNGNIKSYLLEYKKVRRVRFW